ncbi:MAG: type 4 pilus major pilin [Bilophila sp.]
MSLIKRLHARREAQAGYSIGEILIYFGLVALAVALIAYGANKALNVFRVTRTQENLLTMRMQIQQLFSGASDYTGLDNTMAINAGLAPSIFVKGTKLLNPWGGNITLASESATIAFTIQFDEIPREECTRLAAYQPEAWLSVDVNGNVANGKDVVTIAGSCSETNTITFTAR